MTNFFARCATDVVIGDVAKLMYEGQRKFVWELFTAVSIGKGSDDTYPIEIVWQKVDDENVRLVCEYRTIDVEMIYDRSETC